MSHNNLHYRALDTAHKEANDEFYDSTNISTNGKIRVGNPLDGKKHPELATPDKPDYADGKFPNWPDMNHEEAELFVYMEAPSEGSDDGYYWSEG